MDIAGYSGLELLGRGGFSSVYRAHQSAQSRDVALKVLSVDVTDDAARSRFERECAANGRLGSHPNVMTVFESGYTQDGKPYISMELCVGGSLADQLSRGTFPVEEVLRIGIKVAGAVETAHRSGITHRDIKPENILTTSFGEHVLADFGISALDNMRSGTATAGSFTLSHVPPEVLQGEVSGVPGDVYSLGSTLYRLLTGRPPFADETTPLAVAITRTLNDPVPDPGNAVPAGLTRALEAAMAKDPSRRPATALDFAGLLQDVQRSLGLAVTDPVVAVVGTAASPASVTGEPVGNPAAVTPAQEHTSPADTAPGATEDPRAVAAHEPAVHSTPPPVPASVAASTSVQFDSAHVDGVAPGDTAGDGKKVPKWVFIAAAGVIAAAVGGIALAGGSGGNGTPAAIEIADTTVAATTVPGDTTVAPAQSTTVVIPSTTAKPSGSASGSGSKTPVTPTAPKITTAPASTAPATTAAKAPAVTASPTTAATTPVTVAAATTTTVKLVTIPTLTVPNLTILGCLTRAACAQALYDAWKANDVTKARAATTGWNNYQAVTLLFGYPYSSISAGWPAKVEKYSDTVYTVTSTRTSVPKKWTFVFEADPSSVKVNASLSG